MNNRRTEYQKYLDKYDKQDNKFAKRFESLVNSEGEEISKAKKAAYYCVAKTLDYKQPYYEYIEDSEYMYSEYKDDDGVYHVPYGTIAAYMYQCNHVKYQSLKKEKMPSDILTEFLSSVEFAVDCCADGKEAEDMIAIAEYINEIVEWLIKD